MIKFFRNIRQNALKEGRIWKYLKYAVGEIVLVVIGIFIALQLNAWKDGVKERQAEQMHLKNIKEDLLFQLDLVESQMKHDSLFSIRADSANLYFTGGISLKKLEQTLYGAYSLGFRKTFVESEASFNELMNTGGLSIIKDLKLRKSLMEYYQQLKYTSKVVQANNGLIDAMFNQSSTNNSPMFSFDENGKIDTTITFTGKELYRLHLSIKERKDLCQIALVFCDEQRLSTIALISEVDKNIEK